MAVGSGGSYNAACCVKKMYAQEAGLLFLPAVPTRADTLLNLLSPDDTLNVVISQSGESTSAIGVLDRGNALGYRSVALTQEPASPVAAACTVTVDLSRRRDVVPKTKGFTATVLLLQLMALAMITLRGGRNVDAICRQLIMAFPLAAESIEKSVSWAKKISPRLAFVPHLLLLAEGDNRPMALEGALKLLETLYIPAVSYEFEEYLHGVQCTVAEGSYLILIVSDNQNRERMLCALQILTRLMAAPASLFQQAAQPAGRTSFSLIRRKVRIQPATTRCSPCRSLARSFPPIKGLAAISLNSPHFSEN